MKGYLITAAIIVVVDIIACILLWDSESDALLYILWGSVAVVLIYAKLLKKKLEEDFLNRNGRR